MEWIESSMTGNEFALIELEDKLKPLGYTIGGNWDYEHGSFDYKMDVEDGYYYLRLPFHVVEGELDQDGAIVQLDQPFILHHVYKEGVDAGGNISTLNASINQFQEPTEKDAKIDLKHLQEGKELVSSIEQVLLS